MSRLVANRDGGTSNEYGTFVALGRLLTGDVIEGFQVVPNGTPNMTVLVNPGSGRVTSGTYPSSYSYFVSHDTVGGESVTIATAAASPRIDYIVGYVNKGATPSTLPANVNNTNSIFVFASVAGTPGGSPVVPTISQIQTAIGAANPYFILAQVAVGALVTTITTPNITDLRNFIVTSPNTANGLASWSSYIPTFSGLTVGNGTVVGKYTQIGKTTMCRIDFIFGSTSSVSGDLTVSLPVTSTVHAGTPNIPTIGNAQFYNGSLIVVGTTAWASTTTAKVRVNTGSQAIYSQITITSASIPFTWAVGSEFACQFVYEAA